MCLNVDEMDFYIQYIANSFTLYCDVRWSQFSEVVMCLSYMYAINI